jgi:CRISPR-associated Csx2 family protein
MAKILISSLGTGQRADGSYSKAKYKIENEIYETSFIADALNRHLDFDKIFLVGTRKSIWDEAYMVFGGTDDVYLETLYEQKELGKVDEAFLERFKETTVKGLEPSIVKYGLDDSELWNNFTEFLAIAEKIEDGDELYLDITHSFRSLALMSFVMTQFAHTISDKNFKIKGVFYGMFEYKWENSGVTPIVDIKILFELQEWIKAIDAIKNYSDFNPLVRLLDENKIEKEVQNTFINLNNTIGLANIASIRQFIQSASKKIKSIENSENKIVKLLAPEIVRLVEELDKERESDFQYILAQWFYKNKNYALSYIALYEAIITKSCELSNYDISNHDLRENAKRSIGYDRYGKYFYTKYDDSISVIRNAIVHQSHDRKQLVALDIKKLERFIDSFEGYFKIGK